MKTISLLTLCSVAMLTAQETDRTAWQWQQAVTVESSGLILLDLPVETLEASQSSLADLRLVSPDDVTTPYLLDTPKAPRKSELATLDFKASIVAHTTVLEAATNPRDAIAAITLVTPANQFLKSLKIEAKTDSDNWEIIAPNEVVFRQADGTARLRIPLPPASWSHLRVTIADGRSKPIPFTGLNVTLADRPPTLVFFAPEPGAWSLFTGNRQAVKPHYGLASLRNQLKKAGGRHRSPGPLTRKFDFQAPPALPHINPAGAAIDLAFWSWRRPVEAPPSGLIELIPDPLTLARSRRDLRDLRVIQNGTQVPFLIKPSPKFHALTPEITLEPDPDRPGISRWKVTLPMDGLPARELRASSSSPLFTRSFRAISHEHDAHGNPRTSTLGSATWTKVSSNRNSDSRLHLSLGNGRLPQSFSLETDNGDNPPITLDEVTIRLSAPSLILKRSDPAPLFLYFGNREASPPHYDLRLVRAELLAAHQQVTTLGDAEKLLPNRSRRRGQIDAGSPWLWLALGLLVAFLLFVVAKLLPQADST